VESGKMGELLTALIPKGLLIALLVALGLHAAACIPVLLLLEFDCGSNHPLPGYIVDAPDSYPYW
jgi:hypothetical protein